ncbi:MAG: PQQ-dependent sugar dehydrogenase [Nitrosomonas sp.]|nr:PQQ-dependent sugar dehydrogenase [Nitrosomonas sp.]
MHIEKQKVSLMEVALQLLIIFISVYSAYKYTLTHDIIPKSIIRLPDVYVSESSILHIAIIFVSIYGLLLIPYQLIKGGGVFYQPKRFAQEYLVYLCAYTTASLYIFFVTTINYDPQLIAAIGLFSTTLYVLAFIAWYLFKTRGTAFSGLYLAPFELVKRFISIKGIIVIVYFLCPLFLGKAFVSDRDTANLITQIRIWFNPTQESGWSLVRLYPNIKFSQPILVRQPPGNPNQLYVLERNGRLLKLSYPESNIAELIFDIESLLGEVEIENGALGFDFHPEFGQIDSIDSGHIYLYYTNHREETQVNRLSRFDVTRPDPESRLNSEVTILSLPRNPDGFHNGGSVEFGPDGYLYIGLGEGTHPKEASRYAEVLRSGILRIDIDLNNTIRSGLPEGTFNYGLRQNYLIPKDNPFIGNTHVMDEYWALGLRNPFRFTFDPKTGNLWVGDVGSTVWEEVNVVEKGKHYQFPFVEGRHPNGKEKPEELTGIEEQGPFYTYEHTAYDRAVIGGTVYRGKKFPELFGKYIFADNYSAKIFLLGADQDSVAEAQLIAQGGQYAQRGISSVVQLTTGDILVTLLGAASSKTGEILSLQSKSELTIDEEPTVPKEIDAGSDEYDEKQTRELYGINCSRCHGREGRGDGPDSDSLGIGLPDFTSREFQSTRSDSDIRNVIEKGGAAMQMSPMMPPWGAFLSTNEIDHLTLYTRRLGKIDTMESK